MIRSNYSTIFVSKNEAFGFKLHFTRSIFSFLFATGIKITFSVKLQKLKQLLILLSEADKSIGDRDILKSKYTFFNNLITANLFDCIS